MHKIKTIYSVLVIIVLCSVIIFSYHRYTKHTDAMAADRCSDFTTQPEAQEAYNNGATWLDGNDHDGLACESLPLKVRVRTDYVPVK